MNAVHDYADRLLDLAYGELASPEAKELEAHVRGCSQCSNALDEIRGVRRVMGQLPPATEPDAGLESLMAYAEQAARRQSAGPAPSASGWRKWLAPVLGLTAVAALGAVTFTTMLSSESMPSASQVMAEDKAKEMRAPPVATIAPAEEPERMVVEEKKAEEKQAEFKAAKLEAIAADDKRLRDEPKPMEKPEPIARNSAMLDQEFAGNSGGANKDLGGMGKGVGSLSGGEANLGPSGRGDDALAKQKSTRGYEGSGGGIATSGATSDSNDILLAKKKAREQEKVDEFDFNDGKAGDKAPAKEQDVSFNKTGTAARYEPKKEEVAQPSVVSPPVRKAAAKTDSYKPAADDYAAAPAAVAESTESSKNSESKKTASNADVVLLQSLVQRAREAKNGGNYSLAAQLLRQAAVLPVRGPDHAGALILLGEAEAALGNYAASDAAYRQAMALYPQSGTSQVASRKLNENQSQQQTGNPYAPGQHRPADMPKEAPQKSAIDHAME